MNWLVFLFGTFVDLQSLVFEDCKFSSFSFKVSISSSDRKKGYDKKSKKVPIDTSKGHRTYFST